MAAMGFGDVAAMRLLIGISLQWVEEASVWSDSTQGLTLHDNSPSVARPGTRHPLEQPCAAAIQCRLDHGEHDTLEGRSEQHGP